MLSQRQLFLQHVAQTSDAPLGLEIEKAEGVFLYDTFGKKYIDLISGINVSVLGHCHPKIVNAVQQQAAKAKFGQKSIPFLVIWVVLTHLKLKTQHKIYVMTSMAQMASLAA